MVRLLFLYILQTINHWPLFLMDWFHTLTQQEDRVENDLASWLIILTFKVKCLTQQSNWQTFKKTKLIMTFKYYDLDSQIYDFCLIFDICMSPLKKWRYMALHLSVSKSVCRQNGVWSISKEHLVIGTSNLVWLLLMTRR
jgi:hypothetical protein